jgi:hypothetical protein
MLNLVHKLQQRTLKATSVDRHYVAAAYKYMRGYAVWLHELLVDAGDTTHQVIYASCDDKCKVWRCYHCCFIYYMYDVTLTCSNNLLCPWVQVKIGEPSLPIQLAARGKECMVPACCELVAGDHDFHVVNLTPSVTLLTEVKSDAAKRGSGHLPSLYKGLLLLRVGHCMYTDTACMHACMLICVSVAWTVYVFLKDSIF